MNYRILTFALLIALVAAVSVLPSDQAIDGTANAPSWSPDGKQILYNSFAGDQSRMVLSGSALASGEDVFPFRAQGSPDIEEW
jgi:Tol biopolymer transport system component